MVIGEAAAAESADTLARIDGVRVVALMAAIEHARTHADMTLSDLLSTADTFVEWLGRQDD